MLKHFRAVAKAVRGELIPEIPSQEKILAVLAALNATDPSRQSTRRRKLLRLFLDVGRREACPVLCHVGGS